MSASESTKHGEELHAVTRSRVARMTGALYAAYIVATILASVLGQIGLGSDQQVYQQLVTK